MRLLHLSGADLDAQDNHGMTALCLAVENGRVSLRLIWRSWHMHVPVMLSACWYTRDE